jgi:HPr kinase/phosphorylase
MADAFPEVTVGEALRARGIAGLFQVAAGAHGLERPIRRRECQRVGVALTGYTEHVDPGRVQVIGNAESGFLATLEPAARLDLLAKLVRADFPAVVVTAGHAAPPELVTLCDAAGVVLLTTALISAEAVARLDELLGRRLAPRTLRHGTLVDVYGIGVLLLGKSGIGKSEVALELVESGHRLVADDVVVLSQEGPDLLIGSGEELARHHMDIRGLGIINVKELFGAAAVRDRKRVELAVELVEWNDDTDLELLGIEDRHLDIVGVEVPHLRIPVRPGRSLKIIVEVAARNRLLRAQGTHPAREFRDRLQRRLSQDLESEPPQRVEADRE